MVYIILTVFLLLLFLLLDIESSCVLRCLWVGEKGGTSLSCIYLINDHFSLKYFVCTIDMTKMHGLIDLHMQHSHAAGVSLVYIERDIERIIVCWINKLVSSELICCWKETQTIRTNLVDSSCNQISQMVKCTRTYNLSHLICQMYGGLNVNNIMTIIIRVLKKSQAF